MTEFNPNPTKLADLDAEDRFALALFVSIVLHLVLTLGVQIKAAPQSGTHQSVMQVRIDSPTIEISGAAPASSELAVVEKTDEPEIVEPQLDQNEALPTAMPDLPPVEEPHPLLPALEIPLLEDPTWYPAKQVDVHPSAIRPIEPDYPIQGVEQGIDGNVLLLLLIDEVGVVKEASVMEANPEGVFEESALFAFRQARFTPAQKNGRAVKSRVLIRVSYELTKRSQPLLIPPVKTE